MSTSNNYIWLVEVVCWLRLFVCCLVELVVCLRLFAKVVDMFTVLV